MNILRKNLTKAGNPLILKSWLGGLDSNQDRQSQSLQSYQLDDLPAEGGKNKIAAHSGLSRQPRSNPSNLIGLAKSVNQLVAQPLLALRPSSDTTNCHAGPPLRYILAP